MAKWYRNDNFQFLALISMESFRIFTAFYEALFSIKTCFYETTNIFYLDYQKYFHKTARTCILNFNKNQGYMILETFCSYTYFSSSLQTKPFAWKRNCEISLKLHMLYHWPRPFSETFIKFYKAHERDLSLTFS